MKYLLKAEEGEQFKKSRSWDLTFYDDETGEISTVTEFQDVEGGKDDN